MKKIKVCFKLNYKLDKNKFPFPKEYINTKHEKELNKLIINNNDSVLKLI
jgi:hypothetical protein